jgi:hypothetical protein
MPPSMIHHLHDDSIESQRVGVSRPPDELFFCVLRRIILTSCAHGQRTSQNYIDNPWRRTYRDQSTVVQQRGVAARSPAMVVSLCSRATHYPTSALANMLLSVLSRSAMTIRGVSRAFHSASGVLHSDGGQLPSRGNDSIGTTLLPQTFGGSGGLDGTPKRQKTSFRWCWPLPGRPTPIRPVDARHDWESPFLGVLTG